MSKFYPIDLHIHSYYSGDGEYKPSVIVDMCIDAGITEMAIADHNTIKGSIEAIDYINELKKKEDINIKCYPAVEIDCMFNGLIFHMLAYDIDLESKDFRLI